MNTATLLINKLQSKYYLNIPDRALQHLQYINNTQLFHKNLEMNLCHNLLDIF